MSVSISFPTKDLGDHIGRLPEIQWNNQIVDSALDRLEQIKAGKGLSSDDEPFVVPGAVLFGFNNKLFAQDTRLMSHTRKAWPLLHADREGDCEGSQLRW